MRPIRLGANRFPRFYRGGAAIDELRGTGPGTGGAFLPEDWVGSTTTAFGSATDGLTRLEDGRSLRAPSRPTPRGSWAATTPRPTAPTRPCWSSCWTPASGCRSTSTPTGPSPAATSTAPGARPRPGLGPAGLDRLRAGRGPASPGVERLFPAEADPFFRAERLRPDPAATLEPDFSILVVTAGWGRLDTGGGALDLARGDTVLVPFAAGPGEVRGRLEAVRALPPSPAAAPACIPGRTSYVNRVRRPSRATG